jgi:hypothetical protein
MQMRLNRMAISSLLVSLNICGLFAGQFVALARHDQDKTTDWVSANYQTILDCALPSGFVQEGLPQGTEWLVSVRIVPPLEWEPEFQFTFRKADDGISELTFALPMGYTLREQLLSLKKKHPDSSIKAVCGKMAVARHTINQSNYPKLGGLATDFENIRTSPVPPRGIILDGTFYHFWIESFSLHQVHARLEGYGPDAKKQPHPMVEWAEDVRRVCMKSLAK